MYPAYIDFRTAAAVFIFIMLFMMAEEPARAESVFDRYFSGSQMTIELSQDTITDSSKLESELEVVFQDDSLSGFLRFSNDRPFAFQKEPFSINKRGFTYEFNDDWKIQGGDYSLIFGRGLALNAVEQRSVDRDAQLDGAMVIGNIGFGSLTAFWGTHKSDRFEYYVSGVNTDDRGPADTIFGSRLESEIGDFNVGLSWLYAKMTRQEMPLSTSVAEINVSWDKDDWSLYYEGAIFKTDIGESSEDDSNKNGRGQVAEVIYSPEGFSVSASWVRYRNAYLEYATAPSLKRPDVDDSSSNADDETGYKIETKWSPESWKGNSVRALYTNLKATESNARKFKNFFVEWNSSPQEDWSISISYDHISGFQQFYGGVNGRDENYRISIDGPCPLGGSFHWQGRYRLLSNAFEDDEELELGIDWKVNEDFVIGFFRETSTRQVEPPPPGMIGIPIESPGHWNMGFVRWTPDQSNEYELMIGSQRGGFQCSGGTCAQLPPFKGVKFTYYRLF